jgi:hypothetical protein
MAKRREPNAERRVREKERLATVRAAGYVAMLMELEIEALRAGMGGKRRGTYLDVGEIFEEFCDGEARIFTHRDESAYNAIGRLLCEYNENPPKFLRRVADFLEGKEPYSSGNDWYDVAVNKAYQEACFRFCKKDEKSLSVSRWPTFSEFEKVFSEQNPKLLGASARSLRRSLTRLALLTHPDKRGRPRTR